MAPVPAEPTSTESPKAAVNRRSATGDRQMLPVQTHKMVNRRSAGRRSEAPSGEVSADRPAGDGVFLTLRERDLTGPDSNGSSGVYP